MENAAEHFEAVMSFFRGRSIDEETVRTFLPFIMRVTDTEAQYKYKDLAFPYTQPGSEKIEGFELRGYNNFRQKAPGTNSSSAAWIADFTKERPDNARNIYFFESGYDAMAFYQVNRSRLNLETSVFVSTGGTCRLRVLPIITHKPDIGIVLTMIYLASCMVSGWSHSSAVGSSISSLPMIASSSRKERTNSV